MRSRTSCQREKASTRGVLNKINLRRQFKHVCTRCRQAKDKSELCPVGQALIDAGLKAMQDAIEESNE